MRPTCWTERNSPGCGCGRLTPEIELLLSALPAQSLPPRPHLHGPGMGSGARHRSQAICFRSQTCCLILCQQVQDVRAVLAVNLGLAQLQPGGGERWGHARLRAWLMSILWTEAPQHQAPTCPPRPQPPARMPVPSGSLPHCLHPTHTSPPIRLCPCHAPPHLDLPQALSSCTLSFQGSPQGHLSW